MNEQAVVDQMESIQTLCQQIASSMHEARKQGRMMTLEEARRMDELSMELKKGIDEVAPDPFEGMLSPLQRNRVGELLGEIRSTLLAAVEPSAQSGIRTAARMANAAPSSLKAYKAF
jgi:hypothetical protein